MKDKELELWNYYRGGKHKFRFNKHTGAGEIWNQTSGWKGWSPTNETANVLPSDVYQCDHTFYPLPGNKREVLVEAERRLLIDLLQAIRGWDQLPTTGDGPFWIQQIDAAMDRIRTGAGL